VTRELEGDHEPLLTAHVLLRRTCDPEDIRVGQEVLDKVTTAHQSEMRFSIALIRERRQPMRLMRATKSQLKLVFEL
jgi:hypothetical protein